MPCPEFDPLEEEWRPKLRRFDSAVMLTSTRRISDKKRFAEEDEAKVDLDAIEARLNHHVTQCPTCTAEGRTPCFNSTDRRLR